MKKEKNVIIRYDKEGDYLEVYFGKIKKGYFKEIKNKFFERIDEETGEVVGYAIFDLTKRKQKFLDVTIPLPSELLV